MPLTARTTVEPHLQNNGPHHARDTRERGERGTLLFEVVGLASGRTLWSSTAGSPLHTAARGVGIDQVSGSAPGTSAWPIQRRVGAVFAGFPLPPRSCGVPRGPGRRQSGSGRWRITLAPNTAQSAVRTPMRRRPSFTQVLQVWKSP